MEPLKVREPLPYAEVYGKINEIVEWINKQDNINRKLVELHEIQREATNENMRLNNLQLKKELL